VASAQPGTGDEEHKSVRIRTIAVLTGPQPVDGDGFLRADLAALGITVIEADGPNAAARAVASASTAGRVALVDRRFVGHRHALRLALDDPRWPAAHAPGVLTVSGTAREELAIRLRAQPDLTGHRVEGGSPAARLTAPRPLVPDTLAAELASTLPIHEVVLPEGLVARLVDAPLSARKAAYQQVADTDDEAIRLRRAVKSDDGLFTTYFVSSHSRYLARWFARQGFSPNTVTALSLLVAVIGAVTAATGTRAGYVGAALALYVSFVLDCVDGQLARYSLRFSRIGSWLDATFDRVKEYAVYAGLALGSARHGDDVWLLACLALVLQSLRHHVDFAFHEAGLGSAAQQGGAGAAGARAGAARSPGYWARKVVILPIGERWALIALLTAFSTPRVMFTVLLIWGVLAAAYTTTGRVLRSLRLRAGAGDGQPRPSSSTAVEALLDMSNTAVPARFHRERFAARLGWLLVPGVQAVEYAVVLLLAALSGRSAMPLAYVYLAAVIYHHYDTVYRIRAGAGSAPRWLTALTGFGVELRVVVLVVLFLASTASGRDFTDALPILAGYLWALFLVESIHFWTRPATPALPD
jgi:phosphatidylglycerophosphate synthase